MKRIGVLVLVALISMSASVFAQAYGDLTVKVEGLENNLGTVCIAVYDSSDGFPFDNTRAIEKAAAEIYQKTAEAVFFGLPYGKYAVAVFHDQDGDGKCDKNWLNLPDEGVGVSGNKRGFLGKYSFGQSAFTLDEIEHIEQITVRY